MPADDGLYCDASSWNIDRLRLEQPSQPYLPGLKALVPLERKLGPARSIRFGEDSTILVLYDRSNDLYSLGSRGNHTKALSLPESLRVVDFALIDRETYLLDADQSLIITSSRHSSNTKINRLPAALATSAKLVVERKRFPSLFVGPTAQGQIIVLNHGGDGLTAVRLMTITDAAGRVVHLEPGTDFCLEPRGRSATYSTLLVPDPSRNRILEVDAGTGQTTRTLGDRSTPDAAFPDLVLDTPISVDLYRPEGSTLKEFLDSNSKRIIDAGDRSLPRTILVAEHGAGRVMKLIEMPDSIQVPARWRCGVATPLIGTGALPSDEQEEFLSAPDGDLSRIAIPAPSSVELSKTGQLLIQTISQDFFILLTPQTAIRQNIEYRTSQDFAEGGS